MSVIDGHVDIKLEVSFVGYAVHTPEIEIWRKWCGWYQFFPWGQYILLVYLLAMIILFSLSGGGDDAVVSCLEHRSPDVEDDQPSHHHHHHHHHGHSHVLSSSSVASAAWMVIMGDGLHNFTDGLAIGIGLYTCTQLLSSCELVYPQNSAFLYRCGDKYKTCSVFRLGRLPQRQCER